MSNWQHSLSNILDVSYLEGVYIIWIYMVYVVYVNICDACIFFANNGSSTAGSPGDSMVFCPRLDGETKQQTL